MKRRGVFSERNAATRSMGPRVPEPRDYGRILPKGSRFVGKQGTIDPCRASAVAPQMSDSVSAKIAVVVGIGAVALGVAALRSRYADPKPVAPTPHVVATTEPRVTTPSSEEAPAT